MKILIVDDEAMIREWMQFTLSQLPITYDLLDTATDGLDALDKLKAKTYDLVFVDVTMPRMDGIELIKRMNDFHQLPMIVVLSSHDQFNYAREAFQYKASEYLLKSECSKEKLLELCNTCQEASQKQQLSMNLSYYRTSLLTSVLTHSDNLSQVPLEDLFPELLHTTYIIVASNLNAPNLSDSKPPFTSNLRVFIGNNKNTSFFAYSVEDHLKNSVIIEVLSRYKDNKTIQLGVSKHFNSIMDLPLAINLANQSKQKLFYTDDNYHVSDSEESLATDLVKINEQCSQIIHNIKKNDLDHARDNLSVLHHIITKVKPLDIKNVKSIYYNILSSILIHLSSHSQQVMPNLKKLKSTIEASQKFSDIKSYIDETFYFNNPQKEATSEISSTYILEALNYIHTKYASIESVSQIANRVHLNTDYFSRLFKKEVGIPASTYLMNYKLEVAAQYLSDSSETVYEIALLVGYSNISYFSKIFKAKYNQQPSQYRKNNI